MDLKYLRPGVFVTFGHNFTIWDKFLQKIYFGTNIQGCILYREYTRFNCASVKIYFYLRIWSGSGSTSHLFLSRCQFLNVSPLKQTAPVVSSVHCVVLWHRKYLHVFVVHQMYRSSLHCCWGDHSRFELAMLGL